MTLDAAVLFIVALLVGVVVTDAIGHIGYWAQRLGRSRWRRANLPVGGTVAAACALVTHGRISSTFAIIAAAFAIAAVGWRYVAPLAPVAQLPRERGR